MFSLPHPLLLSIGVVNAAVFAASTTSALPQRERRLVVRNTMLTYRGALQRPWLVATHMFAHASLAHLAVNTFTLLLLSPAVLGAIRPLRFAGLYFGSGLAGGVGQLVSNRYQGSDVPSMGASGALAGMLLFHCVRVPYGEIYLLVFPVQNRVAGAGFLALNAYGLATERPSYDGGGGGIAYGAHLGGALFGAALAPFFRGRAPPLRFGR